MRGKTADRAVRVEFGIEDAEVDSVTHVVALSGEVDLYARPELRRRLDHLVDSGTRRLVIDLADVSFMDSIGLGILFSTMKRLRAVDGMLAVACDKPELLSLFEIVGLERVFAIYPTRGEAQRALA